MSRYQYNIGDYVEYIGDVKPYGNVAGKVHRVDNLNNGCYLDFKGQEFYFLPTEVQLTDGPATRTMTNAEYRDALAKAWDEGADAEFQRSVMKRAATSNPYSRSNK